MKKKKRPEKAGPTPRRKGKRSKSGFAVFVVVLIAILAGVRAWQLGNLRGSGSDKVEEAYKPRVKGALTFNKDIAPILFSNCVVCHRAGQSAPFALLSY